MVKLDKYEKEVLTHFEKGIGKVLPDQADRRQRYQQMAHNTLRKDSRVNIRLSSKDVDSIKIKAMEEGIPYQTLLSSIIHKFLTGRLVVR